jgi:radical SAM superfamily enzyme YgiQ (UPF0313 family)
MTGKQKPAGALATVNDRGQRFAVVAPQLPEIGGKPTAKWLWLVNPFYPKDPHASFGKHVLTPSLALPSIAAATPATWHIAFWDENLRQGIPGTPLPQVAGITVHLTFAERAYRLAAWLRAKGVKVIFGGPHASACADEMSPHADAVVVGNGTVVWPKVLADVLSDTLQKRYHGAYVRSFGEEPPPRRDILLPKTYLTTAGVIAGRGCKNRCDFCWLSTKGLRIPSQQRPAADVAEELRTLGEPYAVFIDNNLGANRAYLWELCTALKALRIIWSAAVSLDVTDDHDLVKEMALAGCTGVFVGFESLNNRNITTSGKRAPNTEEYADRAAVFHRWGIQVNGSFIFGFDHDRPEVFSRTVEWLERVRLESATFHIMTPYPGTPFFSRLAAQGRILTRDWNLYDTAHVVFRPKQMSVEQLAAGYDWAYRHTFSALSIWRRRPKHFCRAPVYLAAACLYKRSNWLWPILIQHDWTRAVWRPFLRLSLRRHLAFRKNLAETETASLKPKNVGGRLEECSCT